jgi:hypothetical protein
MDFELSYPLAKDAFITTFEAELVPRLFQEATKSNNAYLSSLAQLYVLDCTQGAYPISRILLEMKIDNYSTGYIGILQCVLILRYVIDKFTNLWRDI